LNFSRPSGRDLLADLSGPTLALMGHVDEPRAHSGPGEDVPRGTRISRHSQSASGAFCVIARITLVDMFLIAADGSMTVSTAIQDPPRFAK